MKKLLKKVWSNLKAMLLGLVVAIIFFELGCLLLVQFDHIQTQVPSYTLTRKRSVWVDTNPRFSTWHFPHLNTRLMSACYDVLYQTNSYGARDKERNKSTDQPRILWLGDSFVEGYGVQVEERFTDLLEHSLGTPCMNFGCSGNVGPIHYYLIYKYLAKKWEHDLIVIGILSDNDFDDERPRVGRYGPYWEGSFPEYQLAYTGDSTMLQRTMSLDDKGKLLWKNILRNFTYTMNVIDWVEGYLKYRRNVKRANEGNPRRESKYWNYDREEWERMKHSLKQLKMEANDIPILIFTIPRLSDIITYEQEKPSKLAQDLTHFAGEEGFYYIDLLSVFHQHYRGRWAELYLRCDPHWNALGHHATSKILAKKIVSEALVNEIEEITH